MHFVVKYDDFIMTSSDMLAKRGEAVLTLKPVVLMRQMQRHQANR